MTRPAPRIVTNWDVALATRPFGAINTLSVSLYVVCSVGRQFLECFVWSAYFSTRIARFTAAIANRALLALSFAA